MERLLGPDMGDFVRSLHEAHGVVFHLEDKTWRSIDDKPFNWIRWHDRDVDLVVVGIGVRPRLGLLRAQV